MEPISLAPFCGRRLPLIRRIEEKCFLHIPGGLCIRMVSARDATIELERGICSRANNENALATLAFERCHKKVTTDPLIEILLLLIGRRLWMCLLVVRLSGSHAADVFT